MLQAAVSAPFSQHWVLFILFYLSLNFLSHCSVSDDQQSEKNTKQNKMNISFSKTRLELRYDHPFATGRRISTEVIVISVSAFFSFVSGGTFCIQPRHPKWRSFHFPHWKNSSGKFHSFRLFFVLIYTFNQCTVKL